MPATSPGDSSMISVVEAALLGPLQIHAQQHLGPVLRFGAAGAGLNFEKRIVRIEFAVEHAAELEVAELRFDARRVRARLRRASPRRLRRPRVSSSSPMSPRPVPTRSRLRDDAIQRRAFLTEHLRAVRVVPHVGLLQFEFYLFEAISCGSSKSKIPPERVVACSQILQLFPQRCQFGHARVASVAKKGAQCKSRFTHPRAMCSTTSCSVARSR